VAALKRNVMVWSLLAAVLFAGCGRRAASLPVAVSHPPASPAASAPPAGLPAFPGNRRPSNLVVDSGMASDCDLIGPGITPLGDAALLAPGAGQAAYAEIPFDATGGPQPTASFLFEGSRTTGAWVGVADYTTGRWEFHGPYAGTDVVRIDLTGGDNYVSPGQSTWVAVLAPAGEQVLLRALTFGAVQAVNQPPVADFAI
jgi:hypothetical protein